MMDEKERKKETRKKDDGLGDVSIELGDTDCTKDYKAFRSITNNSSSLVSFLHSSLH